MPKIQKQTIPTNVHVVSQMEVPLNDVAYSFILGVFADKRDANRFVKKKMIQWVKENEGQDSSNGPIPHISDLYSGSIEPTIKLLSRVMYGADEWSPRCKYWYRPNWQIETHKLKPRSQSKK